MKTTLNPELTRTQEIPCYLMSSLLSASAYSDVELDRLECLASADDGSNDDGIVLACMDECSTVTARLEVA